MNCYSLRTGSKEKGKNPRAARSVSIGRGQGGPEGGVQQKRCPKRKLQSKRAVFRWSITETRSGRGRYRRSGSNNKKTKRLRKGVWGAVPDIEGPTLGGIDHSELGGMKETSLRKTERGNASVIRGGKGFVNRYCGVGGSGAEGGKAPEWDRRRSH